MKTTWAEQILPFYNSNASLEEFLALTKKHFNLSQLDVWSVANNCATSLDLQTQIDLNPTLPFLTECKNNFYKTSDLSSTNKTLFNKYSGIIAFYSNYSLIYLVTYKGRVSPAVFYAHVFPCLNHMLKLEQAEKSVQEDFLCRINHELKTPLNAIMGQLNIISDDPGSRPELYLDGAKKSAKELLNRIDNLLIFAKYSDEFVSNPTSFNLIPVIQEVIKEFEPVIKEKQLTLIWESTFTSIPLYTDPYYIKRILFSLLENACAYTNQGEIKIRVSEKDQKVVIDVIDSGIGFSPNLITLIKKKAFVQAESYKTRSQKGTGLSLNLCFKIAKNLGGDIDIASIPNKGSVISVYIPKNQKPELAVNNFYGKVLVVEDDANNQLIAQKYLQKLGFSVEIAQHGKEAVDRCLSNSYTFILMDCQMPVMDGYEATLKIKERNPLQPIIACTAHALNESKTRCLNVGMNAFLTKPLDIQALKQIIFETVPECADNFDAAIPEEILNNGGDSFDEGMEFLEKSLLLTFKNSLSKDFNTLDGGLSPENSRKVFHRLKSTYAQFGFVKSQKHFNILQKQENFNNETLIKIKKQTAADFVALEQWLSNKKKENLCA